MNKEITPEQVAEMFAPHPDVVPKQFREQWKAGCIFGIKYGLSTPVTETFPKAILSSEDEQHRWEREAEQLYPLITGDITAEIGKFNESQLKQRGEYITARKHSVTPVLSEGHSLRTQKVIQQKLYEYEQKCGELEKEKEYLKSIITEKRKNEECDTFGTFVFDHKNQREIYISFIDQSILVNKEKWIPAGGSQVSAEVKEAEENDKM